MKRLVIGLVLVVILGIVAIIMYQNKNNSTMRSELTDFAFADTASITRITLKDESGDMIDLHRMKDHSWSLNNNYKARPDAVENLLATIKKLTIKSPINQTKMQSTLKAIISNHTLVEIYTGGGDPVKSYYVGGPNQDHTGTNMMIKGSSRPFVVHIEGFHGFLTPRYFTNELEWRSREVFEYAPNEIASITLTYHNNPNQNWSYENKGDGDLVVARGETLQTSPAFDTLLLKGYLSNYSLIHYESYEETKPQEYIDSIKQTSPIFTIELVTNDGKDRTVSGFLKPIEGGEDLEGNPIDFDKDRLYILVDNEGFYVAQYAIFDKLTKGVYFFK